MYFGLVLYPRFWTNSVFDLVGPYLKSWQVLQQKFDTRQFDSKMDELLSAEGQDFFTSYDEVTETFDAMGLLENLLRGIYAYDKCRLQYIAGSYVKTRLFIL
nr:eukaryotic initiation factor 4A-15-like [Tanacetum cinerariifolium]